jgi:hypothetical protein
MRGDFKVKFTIADGEDRRLLDLCHDIAYICSSHKFKKLRKEMERLYRKSGVQDASRIAFQDSLFSIYLEQLTDTDPSLTTFHSTI